MPTKYSDLVGGKLDAVWKKCAIEKVDENNAFKFKQSNTCGGQMVMQYYNYHSLATNIRESSHLNSLFANLRNIKQGDKVLINIAIEPMQRLNWIDIVQHEVQLEKSNKPRTRNDSVVEVVTKGVLDTAVVGVDIFLDYNMTLLDALMGMATGGDSGQGKKTSKSSIPMSKKEDKPTERMGGRDSGGSGTSSKKVSDVAKVNITILSSSTNMDRAKINLISVAESYKELNDDNELVLKELEDNKLLSKIQQIGNRDIVVTNDCVCSTKEMAKLIQLPHKLIQKEHKIKAIDTLEIDLPKTLLSGSVAIGVTKFRGKEFTVYRSQDRSLRCLPYVAVGSQNSGKTTLMKRIAYENFKSGDANLIIDTIEDNKIALAVKEAIPQEKRHDIDVSLDNMSNIPSFSFNEISNRITEDMNPFQRLSYASDIAEQVELIINSITDESTGALTDPMIRFLYSACVITFIKPQSTLQDVFDVLRKPTSRDKAIAYAMNSGCFEADDDVFTNLTQLDKTMIQKHKVDGIEHTEERIINNDSLIVGICNRITQLEKVPYIRKMLAQRPSEKDDFLKCIEEGKTIVVSVPQYHFKSKKIRDMIATYYFSRIWLAVQTRRDNENATPCHILMDEVYTIKGTMKLIETNISEFRRHRLGLFVSCHFLKQFGHVLESIKSVGTSFILLSGTEKSNYEMLKEELQPFELDDLLNLKQYHGLVLQKYEDGYVKYIAKIPNFELLGIEIPRFLGRTF